MRRRPSRIGRAQLLERIFDIDVRHNTNCGCGRLKVTVAILELRVTENTPRQ